MRMVLISGIILMLFINGKEVSALQETATVEVKVFYRYNCPEDAEYVSELRRFLSDSGLIQNRNVSYMEINILENAAEFNSTLKMINVTGLDPLALSPVIVISGGKTTILLDKIRLDLVVPIVNSLLKGEEVRQPELGTLFQTMPGLEAPFASSALWITSLFSGFYSGINPCAIALFTFLLAVSLRQSVKRAFFKVIVVSLGVLLSYMLFGVIFLLFRVPLAFITPIKVAATFMMVAFGVIHLGGYFQSELFIWKTPRRIYNYIVKVANMNTILTDFYLGALFGFIKIPCIGPFYIYWIFRLFTEPSLAPLILITFNLGMIFMPLILSIFTILGLIRFERLRELKQGSRQPYKLITGVLLLALAALMWLF